MNFKCVNYVRNEMITIVSPWRKNGQFKNTCIRKVNKFHI